MNSAFSLEAGIAQNLPQYNQLVFPASKFFKPNKNFYNYMLKNFKDKLIYDVGAGCGHVAKGLSMLGMAVIALDLIRREETDHPILFRDATNYSFSPYSVVMMCRPCHGVFPDHVIVNAAKCSAETILYVGLERNVDQDLDTINLDYHGYEFVKVASNVGKDHENIWRYDQ